VGASLVFAIIGNGKMEIVGKKYLFFSLFFWGAYIFNLFLQ